MPLRLTRRLHRILVTIGVVLALGMTGCPWWPQDRQAGPVLSDVERGATAPNAAEARKPAVTASAGSTTPLRDALAADAWSRTPQSLQAEIAPSTRRWQHYALEQLLDQPEPPRQELVASLKQSAGIVAANAAIGLARLGDSTVADRLVAIAGTATLKLPMRCAAIEALAELDHPHRADLLRGLLGRYGRFDSSHRSPYVAELHAELLHGLGRLAEPADQPQFLAALRSPDALVRLEALRAMDRVSRGELPTEVTDLRTDPDARVRAVAMVVLARHRCAHVEEYLAAGLTDYELRVRIAAIGALGTLPTESAHTTLRKLLGDSSELIRAATVSALASAGDKQAVLDTASDKSWRVRLAVARALAACPDREAAAWIRKFFSDPSAPVEQEAIRSLAAWPLGQSGPLLLEAMGSNVYTTRKASAELLAQRWPPAHQFSPDAPAERRHEILDQLQQQFRGQITLTEPGSPATAARPAVTEERIAQVERLVRRLSDPALGNDAGQQASAELKALGTGGVDALEKIALERSQHLPPLVYHDVLPQVEPVFAMLDRMTSSETSVRRHAASGLAETAAKHPLRPLAVARLAEVTTSETDPLVWQSVLDAVVADGSEPATRLAAVAIGHPAPEVRRRACEHLAAHPDPGHVPLLVPALEDQSEEVVAAAARALGKTGRMEDLTPLRWKLGASNEMIQLEAALALARLGDPSGIAAMERLSYSGNEDVRRSAATAMGEIRNPSFVPILIRFLDDRQSVRVAALAALPKVVGQDAGTKPGEPPPRMAEHVDRWKRWYQER